MFVLIGGAFFLFFAISSAYFIGIGISIPLIAFALPLLTVLISFLLGRAIIGVILYPVAVFISSYLTSAYASMKMDKPLWILRDGSFTDYLMYLHLKLFIKSPFYLEVQKYILDGYYISYEGIVLKGSFLLGVLFTSYLFIRGMFAGIGKFVKESRLDI